MTSPLTGPELLARVKELGNLSKTEMVQACGYTTAARNGKVRTNFTAFYEALLEAKGMSFGEERPTKGRQASYRVRVQGNGNLLIGSAYTKKMGLEVGAEFEIKLGRKQIVLIPTAGGSLSGDADEDIEDEDIDTSDSAQCQIAA